MVSQNQDAEWGDHPPVRSGSMLSLDGRQRPQVARTPPSYYDAVRSRHSLSHPVGRQQESNKHEKQYFPPHEKYNSLPRPLPQRYAVAMTNGHEKFPAAAPHGSSLSPWPGSPQNTNGGWNSVSTDGAIPSPPRTERPPRPQELLPHEYRSPPGPANPVPQVHLPQQQRSREAVPNHLLSTGPSFPGQYSNGHQEQLVIPLYNKHSAPPVDDGQQQQYGSHFGDVRGPSNHFPMHNSPQRRRHPPTGPRQHPPPPPIPSQQQQQQRLHPPIQPLTVTSPPNGAVEMRRPSLDRRDSDGNMQNGRWMRRSYPSTSEDMSVHESQYYRSHSQEMNHGHKQQYDPRYSKCGTLPSRPRSHGADLVLPAPAISVRTGPLGTYPESRPTHTDHLPPPSSPQPSSLPDMSNGLSPRGSKQPRNAFCEKEGMSKCLEPKGHQHQPSMMSLNDALLFPNGLPLRKSVSSSTASLCSEASSASSRARRTQSRTNGDTPIKRVPLNSKVKGVANDVHGKKDKDSVISPSPWAREEKEKQQKRQVQDARRARDEEIEHLEGLPDRTNKQDEILRILRLEREFQKRAEEMADHDDEDDEEDELLDRAEHMERMLRMQEETARSRSKQQSNTSENNQQHTSANSSDDWLARRKMHHLSRIAEENGDFHRDLHLQNGADVEQLSEFLDNLSMQANRKNSSPQKEDLNDTSYGRNEEIYNGSVNGYNGQQEIKSFHSYEANNILNENDRSHAFPVPAPRTSKTHIPPPVPPKSKVQHDSNEYSKADDSISSLESLPAVGYVVAKEVKSSPKAESSHQSLQEITVTSQWVTDLKSSPPQALHNGCDSSMTTNGLSMKTAREVDIANLYASSKMRNGFVDSRPELEKSPELQKLWTSRPEKLTFQDKIRKFSLQAGEEEVPKDKVKNSRAQREIEIKFNEGHSKCAAQET